MYQFFSAYLIPVTGNNDNIFEPISKLATQYRFQYQLTGRRKRRVEQIKEEQTAIPIFLRAIPIFRTAIPIFLRAIPITGNIENIFEPISILANQYRFQYQLTGKRKKN